MRTKDKIYIRKVKDDLFTVKHVTIDEVNGQRVKAMAEAWENNIKEAKGTLKLSNSYLKTKKNKSAIAEARGEMIKPTNKSKLDSEKSAFDKLAS